MAGRKKNLQQSNMFQQKVPQMPEGYYSGDKPNPNLRAFVEDYLREKPYNPITDSYNVPAFDHAIETTKATAIYNMHTYWSKKPHDAIRQYICHYTQPGDLVLDPFSGSGGTALAALMEGRKAIAIDRSPAATFITKNYCTPVDVEALQTAFEELKQQVKPEIDWLYQTRCDRCDGPATTAYTVYSQVFECSRCMSRIPLFDCTELESQTADGKPKKITVCPHCYKRDFTEEISTRSSKKFGAIPVLVSYLCENGCKPAREERRYNDSDPNKRDYFEKYDLAKIKEIESRELPHWYPKDRMMNASEDQECWGVKWRAGTSNFRTVDELFTKRNLWALAAIKAVIGSRQDGLALTFTSLLLNASKMQRVRLDNNGNITNGAADLMNGTYYIPQTNKEINCLYFFESRFDNVVKAWHEIRNASTSLITTCQSSTNISSVVSNSMDYIFTDPPYADKIQYGELNFVWEAWLGFDTKWHDDEIIVNEVRGKTEDDWARMMAQAMKECYRVLKPGRWLSLCYHDTSEGTWTLVQDIMAEAGFITDKSAAVLFIDTGQKSYNQVTADKVTKRDLIINFRKPKPGEVAAALTITGDEDDSTFREKAQTIIRDYLLANPGTSKDRVYDEVVSRMVRAGQMEAHNFDELLRQVAEEVREPVRKNLWEDETPNLFGTHEIGRWYLKETETVVLDTAEAEKEEAAAQRATIFIKEWIKKHPNSEGVHYSDLFEHYIYSVADKPRRPLNDWLLDYFYKTEEGTYRLPLNANEEEEKKQGRTAGTNRQIKRFLAYLQQGVAIPDQPNDATLAEWIRHCKRTGLFEQGKLLYEKGGLNTDNLPDELAVSVEEDYAICSRRLAQSTEAKKPKKSKKNTEE
ncbi:DNA methyltransferase [Candidatus Chlorohelix sp.]|uniref:DNA methyltransferase n=1 Tax=Candidatus Chlorohelix sp. TaxID=3139201 RepID=UPI0030463B6F